MKKRKKLDGISMEDDAPEAADEISELLETENKWRQAEQIIATLGKRCIELLQHFYFEKLSMKSIAKKMDFSSEKIAKNQKYKCIERAKERLLSVKQD